jgi:hypothetical protein
MSDKIHISRRTALQAGMTVLAASATATAAMADDPLDAGKMDKSVVAYRYHHGPHDRHCQICANFLAPPGCVEPACPPARCKLVAGPIDPNGYCTAFASKKAA